VLIVSNTNKCDLQVFTLFQHNVNGDGQIGETVHVMNTTSNVSFSQVMGRLVDSILPRGFLGAVMRDIGTEM
jgi:hypothetical protein